MEGVFCRNDMTLISANQKAFECKETLERFRTTHPRVLRELQTTLRNCRNLTDMFRALAAPDGNRTGLVYDLSVDGEEMNSLIEQKTREHMLQFTHYKLPASYCSRERVCGWIARQQAVGDVEGQTRWSLTWEELQRCRAEFASKDGAWISLRVLYAQFSELNHRLSGYSEEQWSEFQAALAAD